MTTPHQDTIFALSSAAGKAGVAVIRISGPQACDTLKIFNQKVKYKQSRLAQFMPLFHPGTNDKIDEVLIVGFQAPNSFTGEDVIELQCHGSPAVLTEIFAVLSAQKGFRMADHGEFTRRAFENEKMDLTEAEAIADLIDAETKAQKDQALAQMDGALSTLYQGWAKELSRILAYVEAVIDFPDEDVPDDEIEKVKPDLEMLAEQIDVHLNDNRRGERLREGIKIAVIGAPNAGKSSFVNALAQRDVAIVSDMAGTTRDIIEAHLNLGGYPVIIADTAGLRPDLLDDGGHEAVEGEGIRRALAYAREADYRILMFDASESKPDEDTLNLIDENTLILLNKVDKISDKQVEKYREKITTKYKFYLQNVEKSKPSSEQSDDAILSQVIDISIENEIGLSQLLEKLKNIIANNYSVSRETLSLTRARHRENLTEALANIHTALEKSEPELLGQELRFALHAIGRITGRVDVEDLLDIIFKDFCIGK
ncbi:MAG: tRNA uridine-5-carboxymethylaminomethyl(34) synthesis GTPase MnmE [Pseudomonadota bacterium]